MMAYTDINGLAGVAFALGVTASRLPVVARLARVRFWLVAAIMVLAVVPISGLSVAGYVRGVSGDLSVTSLLLLGLALRGQERPQWRGMLLLVVVMALILYPAALGVGSFDPYRWGYGSPYLLAALLAAAFLSWRGHHSLIALAITVAVATWTLGGYESANLWDYLLDPWLAMYALLALISGWLKPLQRS